MNCESCDGQRRVMATWGAKAMERNMKRALSDKGAVSRGKNTRIIAIPVDKNSAGGPEDAPDVLFIFHRAYKCQQGKRIRATSSIVLSMDAVSRMFGMLQDVMDLAIPSDEADALEDGR